MSNGTHVDLVPIKTHSVTTDGPMSNVHISKSNNWHGRLAGGVRRRPQAHAFRRAVVSRPRLRSALGCEGGNVGPRIGQNMVVCMSVCVCVWGSCTLCAPGSVVVTRQAKAVCLHSSPPRPPACYTQAHTHTESDYLFNELFKV